MSLPNDSNSENELYLRQELNDENNMIYNGVNLNHNFENENIFDNYHNSIQENNQFYDFYNEDPQHQFNDEEENFDNTPENTINEKNIIREINFNHQNEKKEEEPIEFNNIPENNEEFDSIDAKTVYFKTININKEKKKTKVKKKKNKKKKKQRGVKKKKKSSVKSVDVNR